MAQNKHFTHFEKVHWAWKVGANELSPSSRLALLAMAEASGTDCRVRTASGGLDELLCMTATTKAKSIAELADHGLIEFVRAGVYELLVGGETLETKAVVRPVKKNEAHAESFDRFWAAYPRKDRKADARKAFSRVRGHEHLEAILSDIDNRLKGDSGWIKDAKGKTYIPHAPTYLNGRRWEDEWNRVGKVSAETAEFILASGDMESIKIAGLLDEHNRRMAQRIAEAQRIYGTVASSEND